MRKHRDRSLPPSAYKSHALLPSSPVSSFKTEDQELRSLSLSGPAAPCAKKRTMGKVEDTVISQMPSERLPLLCQAAPSATCLSQEEVVQQAGTAPWQGLRKTLLCLVGALFSCLLTTAVLLLVTMPRPTIAWWQKSTYYHLPPISFSDSNHDGHGDLEGKGAPGRAGIVFACSRPLAKAIAMTSAVTPEEDRQKPTCGRAAACPRSPTRSSQF